MMNLPPPRPRRSALYMPASNPKALAKARELPADVLIFDLEDAVAPDTKAAARDTLQHALDAGGYGPRELVLRVNGAGTPWHEDDLHCAAVLPVDAVLLPKVETAETVGDAASALDRLGRKSLPIWCMIETPLGCLRASGIAEAVPRAAVLVMGTSDLAKDLRARHTADRLPLLTGLGLVLLAARAFGLGALDGVHLDLEDEAGLRVSCRQGVELGFDGKTLIHPRQIAAANEVFAPDAAALQDAQGIIDAFAAASRDGQGVALYRGRLVESLHVAEARRLLALAQRIADLAGS